MKKIVAESGMFKIKGEADSHKIIISRKKTNVILAAASLVMFNLEKSKFTQFYAEKFAFSGAI
jgi:hypothetical protein